MYTPGAEGDDVEYIAFLSKETNGNDGKTNLCIIRPPNFRSKNTEPPRLHSFP